MSEKPAEFGKEAIHITINSPQEMVDFFCNAMNNHAVALAKMAEAIKDLEKRVAKVEDIFLVRQLAVTPPASRA